MSQSPGKYYSAGDIIVIPTVPELRKLIAQADGPRFNGPEWNLHRDAEHALSAWRVWLPALLDSMETPA